MAAPAVLHRHSLTWCLPPMPAAVQAGVTACRTTYSCSSFSRSIKSLLAASSWGRSLLPARQILRAAARWVAILKAPITPVPNSSKTQRLKTFWPPSPTSRASSRAGLVDLARRMTVALETPIKDSKVLEVRQRMSDRLVSNNSPVLTANKSCSSK